MNLPYEEALVSLLIKKHLTIATAESCTGGLLAAALVNVSGVSECLNESYITYSNEAKMRILQVTKDTLDTYGAVSKECVVEMAENLQKIAHSEVAVSISGIAGPNGGSTDKPVGTVFVAIQYFDTMTTFENHFVGSRADVRHQTVEFTLKKLIEIVQNPIH
jgi:nicotinamide-nucleotide amidase